MTGILSPADFYLADNKAEVINRNRRGILEKFGIRVMVFSDRVEIRGAIPTQEIGLGESIEPPNTISPAITRLVGEGEIVFKRGLTPLLTPRRG